MLASLSALACLIVLAGGLPTGLLIQGAGAHPAEPAANLDNSTSLLIKQFSESGGEQNISLSPLGIKIQSLRKPICTIIVAPYKEALIFNQHSKLIYGCNPEQFKSPYAQSLALLNGVTFAEIKLGAQSPTKHKGLSASIYGFTREFASMQIAKHEHHDLATFAPKSVQCVETTKLKIHPELLHFIDRYYGFPYTDGLPLDFNYVNFSRNLHHYLYTSAVTAATFKPSDYALPVGYRRVKDVREIVLDDSAEDSIEMMIGK
jgi:hypothetical protein